MAKVLTLLTLIVTRGQQCFTTWVPTVHFGYSGELPGEGSGKGLSSPVD